MEPLVSPGRELTDKELGQYSRHLVIPDISIDGQRRLLNAKVLCVGAGGLGSPVLLYLAAAGIGTIGIVDHDTVDNSNLQRQIIHGQIDIGDLKTQSAKKKILEINPNTNVVLHEVKLDYGNVVEIFSQYDLIIDGTDNFETRYLINDAAAFLKKPYVWGSILRFDGQASVFWAEHGPCYRCVFPVAPSDAPSCAEAGVLGAMCGTIGAIQSVEAIKLLTGIGEPLVGTILIHDALEMSFRMISVKKDPDCKICNGVFPEFTANQDAISVEQLKAKMDRNDEFLLIDVREPHEYEIVRIPGARLIPKQEFLNGNVLSELPRDKEIILHCRSGVRSADCLAILKEAGFMNVSHVEGGVLAWAKRINPELPVY